MTPDRRSARRAATDAWRVVVITATMTDTIARSTARSLLSGRGLSPGVSEGVVTGLERLGPTFVKLGQLIASSPGVFPPALSDACRRCLDRVPPVPAEQIRHALEADLGRPVEELFASFEDEPLSAASIAQVHACVLHDGRDAVIKVQRPGIAPKMLSDLRILHVVANIASRSRRVAPANPVAIISDLQRITVDELDTRLEADRQQRVGSALHAFGDNEGVTTPEVYPELCGQQTICMQRMAGTPIDQLHGRTGLDREALLRAVMKAWMEAACVHGPFHGDVHAGNVWILDDGRACFLDFGITGELEPGWRNLLATFLATVAGHGTWAEVAHAFKNVGAIPADAGSDDEVGALLATLIDPLVNQSLGDVSFTSVLRTALTMFSSLGTVVPAELVLVLKQLLYFERYAKHLAPGWVAARDPELTRNLRQPPHIRSQLAASPDAATAPTSSPTRNSQSTLVSPSTRRSSQLGSWHPMRG